MRPPAPPKPTRKNDCSLDPNTSTYTFQCFNSGGGARTPPAPLRCALLAAKHRPPTVAAPSACARAAATPALHRAGTPRTARDAAQAPPLQQPPPQGSSTRTHAALRTARTAPARPAPPQQQRHQSQTPRTTHDRRRTTTKRCCVPTRAQSRGRRSMGYGNTGRSPWQRGGRPVPPTASSHASVAHTTTRGVLRPLSPRPCKAAAPKGPDLLFLKLPLGKVNRYYIMTSVTYTS